ncbi:MAG: hypothetical protein K940chlam1_00898 [Candidatus Anoxychlamydiales bacterium]|nr:hypothetical protein [Candidatus Anoxychlamydiales bacterium]NGX36169.1 hypothetical protein [Candidatus Anoxychlamydiales bacterium]
MEIEVIELIKEMNPWLNDGEIIPTKMSEYIQREQTDKLLLSDWDFLWLILTGPRQAGKTTLGKYIARKLVEKKSFKDLLYLNCDFLEIRQWIISPLFIKEAIKQFNLEKPIIFLDEVQRLENPGILLKGIVDLKLPIKMIASGSSQLEIKSKVQEYLTGRQLEVIVLPLSYKEIGKVNQEQLIYGCYPRVVLSKEKEIILKQLYQNYISKDIIEILKIGKPDIMQKLITLLAHNSGQLVNYNQLATDCRVSATTIQHYCSVLEKTYIISKIKPFVGNKRKEIVSNPIYYFIDNGFRNQALRRFSKDENRNDIGLLVESAVFQEILKFKEQNFYDFDIHFWRTKSGAEVDFVLYKNDKDFLPIEVKFRRMKRPMITRSLRSFIDAYNPEIVIIITRNFRKKTEVKNSVIHFIPLQDIIEIFDLIRSSLKL